MRSRLLGGPSPISRVGSASGGGLLAGDTRFYAVDPGAGFLKADGSPFSPSLYPALAAATPRVLGVKIGTHSTSYQFNGVAYGNGIWVGICASFVCTSPDAVNWTQRTLPDNSPPINFIVFGNGCFIASGGYQYCFRSTDGINWTRIYISDNGTRQFVSLAYGLGKWVLFAGNGTTMVSIDNGINWTDGGSVSGSVNSVAFGNGQFVAVCGNTTANSGKSFTSFNGTTWSAIATPNIGGILRSVKYVNNLWVVLDSSQNGTYLETSTNLSSWTFNTIGGATDFYDFTFGDGLYFVVGYTYMVAVSSLSSIPLSQELLPKPIQAMNTVCFADNKFVVPYGGGKCLAFSKYMLPLGQQGTLDNGQLVIPYIKAA